MKWNVYFYNINRNEVEEYNIFEHGGFLMYCARMADMYSDDDAAFLGRIQNELWYHYWCRVEYEVTVTECPRYDRSNEMRVDIYSQVMMNWDAFSEYMLAHRDELRKMPKQ